MTSPGTRMTSPGISVTHPGTRLTLTGRFPVAPRDRLLLIGSICGYGLLAAAIYILVSEDGGQAYDAYAYWLAGRNVLEGQPLYWPNAVDALGAYRYPPLFAQLWAPFTVLPALVFSWAWRIGCLLCLRWLAGSWRNVGLWCLFPFTITEISIANVTFPMAVMSVLALRGRGWMAVWAGALKFGPLILLPYLWSRRPETRRSLLLGVGSVCAAGAASFLVSPESWILYGRSLTSLSGSDMQAFGVISILPNGFADVALRLAIGVALIALAIRRGSDRMAFAASILAVPVLAAWRLSPLLVLPRLAGARRTGDDGAQVGSSLESRAGPSIASRPA